MTKNIFTLVVVLFIGLYSCKNEKTNAFSQKQSTLPATSNLRLDHFNIWVNNPTIAKQKLTEIGFTTPPDSIPIIHSGQGTSGTYFYFLNTYLELIFVYDQNELEKNNEENQDLDFTKRANFQQNGASPFSIALKIKDYNIEKIPFKKVAYHQEWMEENEAIYAAKNSKTNLKEPSVFVVYPKMESGIFESMTQLEAFPTDDASWKAYFKHPNGAQKITQLTITSKHLNVNTETIQALNSIDNVTILDGEEHVMELHFDNDIQKKSFDLRPELPLIIYL